jgi:hypothetical protein
MVCCSSVAFNAIQRMTRFEGCPFTNTPLDSQSPCSSDFHRRISAKHQAMCKTNELKSADHVHQVVLHYFVSHPSSSTGLSHLHLLCLVTYLLSLNSTSKFQIEVTLLDALVPQTSMTIASSILTSTEV